MAETATNLFEIASDLLQKQCELPAPQLRGALRLAIKTAGLNPKSLSNQQLTVVFNKLMPTQLVAQGIEQEKAQTICLAVTKELEKGGQQENSHGPAAMFSRLDKARG